MSLAQGLLVFLTFGTVQVETLRVLQPSVVLTRPLMYTLQVSPPIPYEIHGDTLKFKAEITDTVQIIYQSWRFEAPVPSLDSLSSASGSIPLPTAVSEEQPKRPSGEVFRISGYKSVGVTGGVHEVTQLRQSMDLRLGGKIGEFRVEGVIQDQNLSLMGSERLRALDQVYLQIESPRLYTRIGDLNLSRFVQNLRVRGIRLSYRWAAVQEVEGGYGVEQGGLQQVEFSGVTGKSGPYFLDPANQPVRVVPGSERVYVNGVLLQSGQDYTLDPQQGTITFSPRWVLGPEDRIRIEFQRLDDFPTREIWFLQWTWIRNGLHLRTYQEGASPGLLSQLLSSQEVSQLRALGDTTGTVWVDGGRYVGEGNGAYRLEDSVYVYVGENMGDYQVAFTYRGDGNGAYTYDPLLGGYRYVGRGQGAYEAVVPIEIPSRRRWLEIEWRPLRDFPFQWRGGVLWTQRNIFATTPTHRAAWGEIQARYPFTSQFRVELHGLWKAQGYVGLQGHLLPPGTSREYGLALTSPEEEILFSEITWEFSPAPQFLLRPIFGRLQIRDQSAIRTGIHVEVPGKNLRITGYGSRVVQGTHRTLRWGVTWRFRPHQAVSPYLAVDGTISDSVMYRSIRGGLEGRSYRSGLRIVEDSREAGRWYFWISEGKIQGTAHAIQYQTQVFYTPQHTWGYQLSADWQIGTLSGQNRISDGTLPQTELRYRYVGPGKGTYRYDPLTGQYLPDPTGDYIRETVQPGAYEIGRIREHRVSWRQRIGKSWGQMEWMGRWRGTQEQTMTYSTQWTWDLPQTPHFSLRWHQERFGDYRGRDLQGFVDVKIRRGMPQWTWRIHAEQRASEMGGQVEPPMLKTGTEIQTFWEDGWGLNTGAVLFRSAGTTREQLYLAPYLRTLIRGFQIRGSLRGSYTWGDPGFPEVYQILVERGVGLRYRLSIARSLSDAFSLQVSVVGSKSRSLSRFSFQATAQARF